MRFYEGKIEDRLDYLPTIVVIDNFYDDPDSIREFALSQDFLVKGNYPGMRTGSFATPLHKSKLEKIMGREINYWPDGYNGSFQIVTEDCKSWIHRDNTDYSLIVFLTPDPPPQSGTVFYKHIATGAERADEKHTEEMLCRDTHTPGAWRITDRIENKYNRAILFNGRLTHMSDNYFGNSKETGRLFQTFFFNVKQ